MHINKPCMKKACVCAYSIHSCSCDLQLAPQWAMRHGTSQDIELKYVSSIEYMVVIM
jgi:hypothetical protein